MWLLLFPFDWEAIFTIAVNVDVRFIQNEDTSFSSC